MSSWHPSKPGQTEAEVLSQEETWDDFFFLRQPPFQSFPTWFSFWQHFCLGILNGVLRPSPRGPEYVYSISSGMCLFKVKTRILRTAGSTFSCVQPLMFADPMNFEIVQGQAFWFKLWHHCEMNLERRKSFFSPILKRAKSYWAQQANLIYVALIEG